MSVIGQIIYLEDPMIYNGVLEHEIDMVEFPKGMCFVCLILDGVEVAPIKMIKQ